MTKKRSARRTPAEMSAMLQAWECSGQSRAAFCRAQGIGVWTFQYWQRRFRVGGPDAPAAAASGDFREVRPPGQPAGGRTILARHPNGVELEFDGSVPVTFLRALLGW